MNTKEFAIVAVVASLCAGVLGLWLGVTVNVVFYGRPADAGYMVLTMGAFGVGTIITAIYTRLREQPDDYDARACRLSSHDWDRSISGYYTHGVPHFGPGNSWTVEKKYRKECFKCGKVEFEKEKIGRIRVDKETDELTVTQ